MLETAKSFSDYKVDAHNWITLISGAGLTQKLSESLICVTAKKPRTPSFRRACVSPMEITILTF